MGQGIESALTGCFRREILALAALPILILLIERPPLADAEEPIRRGERFDFAEGRLSAVLPDGWERTDLNAGDVVAGFATQDKRSSLFVRELDPGLGGGMQELLDATVANYEATFEVKDVGKVKSGDVSGRTRKWPAIFTTVEAVVTKGSESFEMRFYLFLFDTGTHLYLVQASTTKPIREAREAQIYGFLRSLFANS
jgi:hypothetical protein